MTNGAFATTRNWLGELFHDREYFDRLTKIALPTILQQFITNGLGMVNVVLVGQLGETAVAAVGLANQIFFLLNLLLFGITSGCSMITAQLWGRQDVPNIRKVLGVCLTLGIAGGLVFLFIAAVIPETAIGVYSRDPAVIAEGSQYLRLFGWSFVLVAITFCYAAILRSIGEVRTPMAVSITALTINTTLSYLLIFGKFGLPQMGILGAAVSSLVARSLECTALLYLTYRRASPAAASLREMFHYDLGFVRHILRLILPVTLNELLWSLGITAYNVVYARISTDAIAAMNIVNSIDALAIVIFIGLSNGCAIVVGHRIGAGERKTAHQYAARSLVLGVSGAVLMGGLILLLRQPLLSLYKVSPLVIDYAHTVLTILAFLLWLRVSNMILFLGILRSGGDTRYALILDGFIIWLVGVPLAFTGAFVFHLPVYWVYLMVMTEEVTKYILAMRRFISGKWLHELAAGVHPAEPAREALPMEDISL